MPGFAPIPVGGEIARTPSGQNGSYRPGKPLLDQRVNSFSVTLYRQEWPGMVGIGAGPGLLLTSPDLRFGARAELAALIGLLGPKSTH